MDLVDRLSTTGFLGKEFLTWLWFRSELHEGLIEIDDGGPAAEIWLTDSLTLSGAGQGAEKVTLRAEDPGVTPEARSALAQGKKVESARLRIVRAQREWTLTLKGETLALSSIKIPAVLTKEEDEKLRERLHLMDQLDTMVATLFTSFLQLRSDSTKWADEEAQLRAWVRGEMPSLDA